MMNVNWKWLVGCFVGIVLFVLIILLAYGALGAHRFNAPWLWAGGLVAGLLLLLVAIWMAVRLIVSEDGLAEFLGRVTRQPVETQPKETEEPAQGGPTPEPREEAPMQSAQPRYSSEQLATFVRYMQKRMDFIAQVSTSAPSWCLTMKWLELFEGFFRQVCLLDNIAKAHLANKGNNQATIYGSKLLLKWKYKNAVLYVDDNRWMCVVDRRIRDLETLGETSNGDLKSLRDTIKGLSVDIPHGHVGAQAFYSIMENLIRNAAKFGDKKEKEQIEFTILVQDEQDEWGNAQPRWKEEFYRVSIFDNLPAQEDTVRALNGYLVADIIKPTGEVKPGQWGMKEIKICAAYLRLVRPEDIDRKYKEWATSTGKEPPLVEFRLNNSGNLTCDLYLFRPKKALLVGERFRSALNNELLRKAGIDVLERFEGLKQEVQAGASLRYDFLVLDGEQDQVDWQWVERYVNCLPYRIIVVGEIPNIQDPQVQQISKSLVQIQFDEVQSKLNNPDTLMNFLWEKWVNEWWSQFEVVARIGHDKDMEHRVDKFVTEDKEWSNALVFDHDWENQDQSKLYKSALFHWSLRRRGDDSAYVQLLSGNRWQIKETAAITVAILDERIYMERERPATSGWGGVDRYSDQAKRLETVWEKRRVYLLDAQKALKDFGQTVQEVERIIDKTGCKFLDFLVIHQGIIDEIIKKHPGENGFQNNWTRLKSLFRWIVIDTGRGEPEQARKDRLRWVEYSNIADCLIQYAGDKFRLAQVLFALRANPSSWRDVT
jgi:hypothetical protein